MCPVNVFSRKKNWFSLLMSQNIWVALIEVRWYYSSWDYMVRLLSAAVIFASYKSYVYSIIDFSSLLLLANSRVEHCHTNNLMPNVPYSCLPPSCKDPWSSRTAVCKV